MKKKTLTAVAVIHNAGHWLSTGLVVPVLALFQVDRGLSLAQLGLNGLVYSAVITVLEIPTGGFSDTFGRRRVYMVSRLFSMTAAAVFIFGRTPLLLAVGFGIMGIARALSSGCMDAYFIDAYTALPDGSDLQRFLARIGIFVPLSLAAGSLAGGYLPDLTAGMAQRVPGFDRYSFLFAAALLTTGLQTMLTLLLVPEDRPARSRPGAVSGLSRVPAVLSSSLRLGIADRAVLMLLLGSAAWGVSFAGLERFWQPFVEGLTAGRSPSSLFGYLTTGYFLVGSLGALVSSRLYGITGKRPGITVGLARFVMGLLFVLLSLAGSVPIFAALYLSIFFLNGVCDSPEQTMFNLRVPSASRSTLLSFQSLFLQFGGGVAGLLFGILSERFSIGFSWRIAGLLFAVSGILYIRSGGYMEEVER